MFGLLPPEPPAPRWEGWGVPAARCPQQLRGLPTRGTAQEERDSPPPAPKASPPAFLFNWLF